MECCVERGYALPLVLLALALLLIYVAQSSSRVVREAAIAKVKTNSEIAFYAAEAGFNRVRARIIGGGDANAIMALDGVDETLQSASAPSTEFGEDFSGQSGGAYSLEITPIDAPNGVYHVTSTGTYGVGRYQATRVVSGTISLKNPLAFTAPRLVHTQYD